MVRVLEQEVFKCLTGSLQFSAPLPAMLLSHGGCHVLARLQPMQADDWHGLELG